MHPAARQVSIPGIIQEPGAESGPERNAFLFAKSWRSYAAVELSR